MRRAPITPVQASTLYVLNAGALTKPHAIEHLAADLAGYCIDVAVISETRLKQKHYDHNFTIDVYSMFRQDSVGRCGGGVAVYISRRLIDDVWEHPGVSLHLNFYGSVSSCTGDISLLERSIIPRNQATIPGI